jgi:hypothetical protein
MKKRRSILPGCAEWSDQIQSLLELPEGDEVRGVWERHAGECSSCREMLEGEVELRGQMERMEYPGHAYIASKVMNRIRKKGAGASMFRPRDLVYGLAASIVGVIIGFQIIDISEAQATQLSPTATFEQIITNFDEGIDPFMSELNLVIEEEK